METVGKLAWHVHHCGQLVEVLFEPIEVRIAFIKDHKPKHEVEIRLRLLKLIKGELPQGVRSAGKAYGDEIGKFNSASKVYNDALTAYLNKMRAHGSTKEADSDIVRALRGAGKAYDGAAEVHDDAMRAYDDAVAKHAKEINALHDVECPNCPWDDEQKTIFPITTAIRATLISTN